MNPVQRFARAGSAIHEGSCIAGVMQDEQRLVEIEFLPQQLTVLRSTSQPAGKQQFRLAEGSHHGTRGTQTAEGLKQKPDALLNLLIGIQRHLTLYIINEADRKRHVQLPTPRFAQQGAAGPRLNHMQFGFTHGALESKQEPVIEIGGMVEAVLIENQGIAEPTDLQEPMPVATVAGQAGDLQPDHQSGVTHAHLGHEFLETLAICR
jgi:hypothetical protein